MNFFEKLVVITIAIISTVIYSLLLFPQTKNKENRIKIAVIDTGIDYTKFPKNMVCGEKSYNKSIHDEIGHGTLVTGLILSQLKDPENYCFLIYKYYGDFNPGLVNLKNEISAILQAYKDGAKFINLSTYGSDYFIKERNVINFVTSNDVVFVTVAGNNGIDLSKNCINYPACYGPMKNFYVVKSPSILSAFDGPVNAVAPGDNQCYKNICNSGTSFSAPNFLVRLINDYSTNSINSP